MVNSLPLPRTGVMLVNVTVNSTCSPASTRSPDPTTQEAAQADKHVGALAKKSLELDKEIERRIRRSTLQIQGNYSISPKLVLDPTKAFLRGIHAKAGITLTSPALRTARERAHETVHRVTPKSNQ